MNDKWEFYKDVGDQWRWRRTSPNGNIVGASTEGYANKNDCEGNARRNGWDEISESQEHGNNMAKKKLNDETNQEDIPASADLLHWLEVEKKIKDLSTVKFQRQLKGILLMMAALLFAIVMILLYTLVSKEPPVDLFHQTFPSSKVTMVVLDPKVDEKVVVFGDTHFSYDKSALSEEAKSELNKDAQSLKDNPTINVRMAGYTSAQGTEEVNQKLSEERANVVRDYLITQGIAPERITVIGYGRTKPAVYEVTPSDNNSKEARENMRVLFEVVVK